MRAARPGEAKLLPDLRAAFRRIGIRDGMTLSFHHHLRDGDGVLNAVLATAAELGLRDLKIAPSAVFGVHAPVVDHLRSGVVTAIDCDYMVGPVARAVSHGALVRPVVLRTHGGRAAAIESGRLEVDVAFVAAPAADPYGNLSGIQGPTACGSLGYPVPDSEHADWVVAVTDHLVPHPLAPVSISQIRVDFVIEQPSIGDPAGILSGTTRPTEDPERLAIASAAAEVVRASGLLGDGFSYQTGAGGTSLAVTRDVRRTMEERGVVGSFALGGITASLVEMLEGGLFRRLLDVQGFDLEAVRSLAANPSHLEIGAGTYASPFTGGAAVNALDCVILGAIGVDTAFNVDVVTGSDGVIMGGSGGHSDAAAGARLAVVVGSLMRRGRPNLTDGVTTVTTPGESIDVLVTDHGVAVNPRRADLRKRLADAGLPVREVEELHGTAARLAIEPPRAPSDGRIVAVVEYRDGTVIDVVRASGGPE
jgi:citrate lyase subunit alpha/citrate CoA-transferase